MRAIFPSLTPDSALWNRSSLIAEVKEFFDIDELVCNHVLNRWGEYAWQFLDTYYLGALLVLRRDVLGKPMYCNNHKRKVYQRGLRCNLCDIVEDKDRAYLSAHVLGKGGDFTVEDMPIEQVHIRIKSLAGAFPCPIRVEDGVSWLHFDVMPCPSDLQRIHFFKV